MPPATNTDVLKVYKEVQNGKSLKRAWEDNGQPGTWGNVQRQYQKLYQAPTPAAAAAGSSSRKRSRATAETPREQPVRAAAAPSAAARSGAATSRKQPASSEPEREGPAIGKKVRRTIHQVEVDAQNKAAFYLQYKAAHKAATLEYASCVEKGTQRRKGCTPADIATKWTKSLSVDSNFKITERALANWISYGKTPGRSPALSGPKVKKEKAAVVCALQSFAQMQQLDGKSVKPSQLLSKATAIVTGTSQQTMLDSAGKRRRLLLALRVGGDAPLCVKPGESIDKRRNDCLTGVTR